MEDRILCALPLSFDYGMYQVFLALFNGAELFLDASRVVQRIPYLIRYWEITVLPTIPTAAQFLIRLGLLNNDAFRTLRCITFTGEVLPIPLIQRLRQFLPEVRIVPMYGLTECKRVSVMPPGREDKVLAGSCGLPLEGVSVRLEAQNPETGVGELVVEGDNVMEGYWGLSLGESQPFFINSVTGKRCLRTGDLFRIDEEGFLYFCDRKNGCLKVRGFRVSGAWLEERFLSCPEVREAAATSVLDASKGELTVVFLSMAPDASREPVLERYRRLPLYLQDVKLIFSDDPLPRNANGKRDYKELRRIAKEAFPSCE